MTWIGGVWPLVSLVAMATLSSVALGDTHAADCPEADGGAWRFVCETDPLTDEVIYSAMLASGDAGPETVLRLSCDGGGYDVAIGGLADLEGRDVEVGYRFDRREPRFERWRITADGAATGEPDSIAAIVAGLRGAERRMVLRVGRLDPVFFDPTGAESVMATLAQRCGPPAGGETREDGAGDSSGTTFSAPTFPIVIRRDQAREEAAAAVLAQMREHWRRPEGISEGLSAELRVRVANDGTVLRSQVVRGSGSAAFDRNAERAVIEASPLRLPADPRPDAQFRNIRLTFAPE